MCKVKSGVLIKNEQDIQNLVIGIINRQQNVYNSKKILELTKHYCKGTELKISSNYLQDVIEDNLSFLYRKGLLDCKNGNYYPQPISIADL